VDRQAITDDLERTERQLVEIAARIQKQKVVLARLEAAGENTAHAAFLLEQSFGWQKLNEAHRARLKRELERHDNSPRLPFREQVKLKAVKRSD